MDLKKIKMVPFPPYALEAVSAVWLYLLSPRAGAAQGWSAVVWFPPQIQPDLRELMETMNRMSHLPPDFEGRQKVNQW